MKDIIVDRINSLKHYTKNNIQELSKANIPYLSDIKLIEQYSYRLEGKTYVCPSNCKIFMSMNLPYSSIPNSTDNTYSMSFLEAVNYKDIFMNEEKSEIMLKKEGQKLDVGGIAKGYAADEVVKILKEYHIQSGLINLGGNVFAFENKPTNENWNIGIQNPFDIRGECVGVVSVSNKSVVTSGNYERYFINNGKRFHHIMNPLTGNPSENGVISATIISDYSIDGDALSTCAFVMGIEEGLKLAESIKGVDALFITENKKIYTTSGIKNELEVTSKEYLEKSSPEVQ